MKKAFLLLVLFSSLEMLSCKNKSNDFQPDAGGVGKMGVVFNSSDYFYHVIAVPLSVYIDGELKKVWDASTTTTDCYGRRVDFLIEAKNGSHTFAFVTSDGHFIDGTMTITNSSCTYITLNEDQFNNSKTNYGTDNGSLTFIRTRLPMGNTKLYVDNKYVGELTSLPYHQICGMVAGSSNVVVPVSPNVAHSYKAVDASNNIQWTGNVSIPKNGCSVITF